MPANQLPRTLQPPPELPNDPKTSDILSQWLRTFSLWCRHGLADKLSISTATPQLTMQTEDVPPAVFQLKVTSGADPHFNAGGARFGRARDSCACRDDGRH